MKHEKTTGTFAAEAVLTHMKAAGIDVLFANGGTDFPSIIEAFARQSETGLKMPEALVIPHEGVAVGMAHGYYLMTSKPAGVIVHVNVGLANSVMGLINARSENVPVMM
ncbi:decarboxylase, partial [Neorhizobium galegae]